MTSRQTMTTMFVGATPLLLITATLILGFDIERIKSPTSTRSYQAMIVVYEELSIGMDFKDACLALLNHADHFAFQVEPDRSFVTITALPRHFGFRHRIMGLQFDEVGRLQCVVMRIADSLHIRDASDPPDKVLQNATLNPAWRIAK